MIKCLLKGQFSTKGLCFTAQRIALYFFYCIWWCSCLLMFTCCALCVVLLDDFISRNLWYFLVFSHSFFLSTVIHIHDIGKIICEAFCFLRAARMLRIDSKTHPIEFTIKYIFYSSYDNKIMSKNLRTNAKLWATPKKATRSIHGRNDINTKNRWHAEHTTIKLKLIITIITKIYFPCITQRAFIYYS